MQILIVVVLYKIDLDKSETISGLCQTFGKHPELLKSTALLIWDNSPLPLKNPQLPIPFDYRHTRENVGVSGAYNQAMVIAELSGCPWLLLLDQDTTLSDIFLLRMLQYSREHDANPDIAAVAPFLLNGSRTISPVVLSYTGAKPILQPFSGVHPREVFAANSGTLIRIASLKGIGGYDEKFWLDFSDVVAFHRLYLQGKRLYIAGDIQLQHRIANSDYDSSMSTERYLNFIEAEGAYWDIFRTALQNKIHTARLLMRAIMQYIRYENKQFSKLTWEHFFRRLSSSKDARLKLWKLQSAKRNLPVITNGKTVSS